MWDFVHGGHGPLWHWERQMCCSPVGSAIVSSYYTLMLQNERGHREGLKHKKGRNKGSLHSKGTQNYMTPSLYLYLFLMTGYDLL